MKRILHLLLLFGALIGLFGQGVAYASMPSPMSAPLAMSGKAMSTKGMSETAMSGMSEDCMKMMAEQQPTQKPCKGMTLACIAAMGCVVPMVVRNDSPVVASRNVDTVPAFWPTPTVLHGSELTPEPEPPTLLG